MKSSTNTGRAAPAPFSFTNRKGDAYFVHHGKTKRGNPMYFVSRKAKGALAVVPDGFEVAEDINAVVFVRRPKPSLIPARDLEIVRAKVNACRHLADHRVEVKGDAIVVFHPIAVGAIDTIEGMDNSILGSFEPALKALGRDVDGFVAEMAKQAGYSVEEFRGGLARAAAERKKRAVEELRRNMQYDPVLRFVLDRLSGQYTAERACYRGDRSWLPLGHGPIGKLASRYVKHVGKESFFDLM